MTEYKNISEAFDFISNFIAALNNEDIDKVTSSLILADRIREIYDKYPYSPPQEKNDVELNLVRLMYNSQGMEMANSRIIQSLLSYNEDNGCKMLKSFLNRIESISFDTNIVKPQIDVEYLNSSFSLNRIDILIQERGKYAIIIENKSENATYQQNQLANYIDLMRYEGYKLNQIYVILLADNHPSYPDDKIWISTQYSDPDGSQHDYEPDFADRYVNVEFFNDIIPWLKSLIDEMYISNKLLYTLIIQYLDYLEKKRDKNNKLKDNPKTEIINMEVKEYLKQALSLNGDSTHDVTVIAKKLDDVKLVKQHIDSMYKEYVHSFLINLQEQLTEAYPDNEIEPRDMKNGDRYPTISLRLWNKDHTAKIGIPFQVDMSTGNRYYGIEPTSDGNREDKIAITSNVVSKIGGFRKGGNWCYIKSVEFDNAFDAIKELATALSNEKEEWH